MMLTNSIYAIETIGLVIENTSLNAIFINNASNIASNIAHTILYVHIKINSYFFTRLTVTNI